MKKVVVGHSPKALAIAILSRIAIRGTKAILPPKTSAISPKEYVVPLTVVLKGGNPNGGKPSPTLPIQEFNIENEGKVFNENMKVRYKNNCKVYWG